MLQPKDRTEYNREQELEAPPCYKVIRDFPNNNDFPVGKIIMLHRWRSSANYWAYTIKDCQGEREYLSDFFDKYPHLFEKTSQAPAPQVGEPLADKYQVDPETKKITGWPTLAEWQAYEKGKDDYDSVCCDEIKNGMARLRIAPFTGR